MSNKTAPFSTYFIQISKHFLDLLSLLHCFVSAVLLRLHCIVFIPFKYIFQSSITVTGIIT